MTRLLVGLAFALCAVAGERGKVPDWFEWDRAFGIYDAWRKLSGPEAVVYGCCNSNVMAGLLHDEDGNLLPNTPFELTKSYGRGGQVKMRVRTDASGYFVIYSPPDVFFKGAAGHPFDELLRAYAIPGYPNTAIGFDFAVAKRGYRPCTLELAKKEPGKWFYELTCSRGEPFAAEEFQEFAARVARETKLKGNFNYEADLGRVQGYSREGRKRTVYQLRFLSEDGHPIVNGIVRYDAADGYQQNTQTVKTDEEGRCAVNEYLLADRQEDYSSHVRRGLRIDVPGGVSGPLRVELSTEKTNVFMVPRPATVSGRITIAGATPVHAVKVSYPGHFLMGYSTEDGKMLPDGSYVFRRVMPGEKFMIHVEASPWYRTGLAPVRSEELIVRPGEVREGVDLAIPYPSAVAGVIVEKNGKPVTEKVDVRISGFGTGVKGNWFMSAPVTGRPRLAIRAEGYDPYEMEISELKPGELRFLRVELSGKGPVVEFKELELLRLIVPNQK